VVPSISEGSRPPTDEPCWKHTWVAAEACQHRCAVVRAGIGADKCVAVEHIESFVIAVDHTPILG